MPVDLQKVPDKIPLPPSPHLQRWLLIGIACISFGTILALIRWRDTDSTHSMWFWFCSLVCPLLFGLSGFIIRMRYYENKRDNILWWNHLQQEKYTEQVKLGQQAVGILDIAYLSPVANNQLSTALLQGRSELNSSFSQPLQKVMTTASLYPLLTSLNKVEYKSRLEETLYKVIKQLQPALDKYSQEIYVRIVHDGTLEYGQFIELWQHMFPLLCNVHITDQNNGVMWTDEWLDQQDDRLLLSLEINLFTQVRDQEAESVSALLMASPLWLSRHKVQPLCWIHRPVAINDLPVSMETVACWGKYRPPEPWFLWRVGIESNALAQSLQAMETLDYMSFMKGQFVLDDTFGMPGVATGNITLICACENAIKSRFVQWVMIGNKSIHMYIVRPVEPNAKD